ncbi:hypothetical protein DXG03_008653 [Asterophora parasitica]|uniref:Carbonic anhydrase n=1 Tax=Asterophora parasitica TaxID=117018 RepID=A0A9P7KE04_9AGAR|nr:hypothetical protein DXG03_008653 [Asterophora parasitica]
MYFYSLPSIVSLCVAWARLVSSTQGSASTSAQQQHTHVANNSEFLSRQTHFGYTGATGPLGWAGLSPNNSLCTSGSRQSPINLGSWTGSPTVNPQVLISDGYGDFENLGTTVEVAAVGQTHFGGKNYQLRQFHFHTPSEHRINEEYFPLEIHLVHQASDGARLVLGAVFEIATNGATTPLVDTLARQIQQIATPGSKTRVYGLTSHELINIFQNHRLYEYYGSLTTPPCSEGITWLVAQTPLALDVGSYLAFKRVLKFNSRYTQNIPGKINLARIAASQMAR